MGRIVFLGVLLAGAALLLAGCGLADSRSPVPEFLRNKAVDPPPPEPPPDVRELVRKNLNSVFTAASNPRRVQVSPPRRELRGAGWTACVKAELTSVTNKPLGAATYRIVISSGMIADRRRAEPEDNCGSESYEPV
jgi:hypothetical protein